MEIMPRYPEAVQILKRRRAKLLEALAGERTMVLIEAGQPRARNYPANTYPFRAFSHFLYFCGLPLPGATLVLVEGRWELFVEVPDLDDALWHGEQPGLDALHAATGVDAVRDRRELADLLSSRPRDQPVVRLPLAGDACGEAALRVMDAVIGLRLVHDELAVHELRRASAVTAQAHAAGQRATRVGATEAAVRAAMEAPMLAANFTTAYDSIVTTRGEVLHNHDRSGLCRAGDLLLADVGAETDTGWAGDVTRVWPASGTLSASQREMYALVLRAQKAAIACVRPGVGYREVHRTACRVITEGLREVGLLRGETDSLLERGAHALFFPHGVGHLLGLDVHDMEDFGDRAGYAPGRTRSAQFGLSFLRLDRDLLPGMAVTIEPGVYFVPAILNNRALTEPLRDVLVRDKLPLFADVRGIRIEDDVLVTQTGCEVLTASIGKEISEIETA